MASLTALQAFAKRRGIASTPYVCPFPDCLVVAQHRWGKVEQLQVPVGQNTWSNRRLDSQIDLWLSRCEACGGEVVILDGTMLWPRSSTAPPPAADMPGDVKIDFEEARLIAGDSPRGAAALLRLALQKLCPHIGATKAGINEAIGELVAAGTIRPTIQQALDSVRVIGNEAVHPGELDLKDDAATVDALFRLINYIVEKTITEPKEVESIFGSLPPAKLDGIKRRDGKSGRGSSGGPE